MFAFISNRDDTVHQFTFTITATETESVVFERSGDVPPDSKEAVEFSDEWLEEAGTYSVCCSIDGGGDTTRTVEVDEMWACNNSVAIHIKENGRIWNGHLHGDGQRC